MELGNVVYTLEDLKKEYDKACGSKSMWAFHCNFHDGHKQCAKLANKYNWTVSFIWNNYAEGMELLSGFKTDTDIELSIRDVSEAALRSDVVMVFMNDYHPYLDYKDEFLKVYNDNFGYIKDKMAHNTLLYSISVRILIHNIYNMKFDYHPQCGRDIWRHYGYTEWCKNECGINIELIDAVRDKYGNCISGTRNRMPEELNKRINKKLLLPQFKTIKQVRNNIKDIKGLKVNSFERENGWINVKFMFGTSYWWYEGLKL